MSRFTPAWSMEADKALARLWREAVPSRDIAELLGRTKNAVLGRVHRLKLEARASPLPDGFVREGKPKPPKAPKVPRPPKKPPLILWAPPPGPVAKCQWPSGERKAYRFCGEPTLPARPYCLTHTKRAYLRFGGATA